MPLGLVVWLEPFASTENEANSWRRSSWTDLLQTNYQWWMATSKSLQAPLLHPNCFALCILHFHALPLTLLANYFSILTRSQLFEGQFRWEILCHLGQMPLNSRNKTWWCQIRCNIHYYHSLITFLKWKYTRVKFLHFGHYKSKAMFSKKFTSRVTGLECSCRKIFIPVAV